MGVIVDVIVVILLLSWVLTGWRRGLVMELCTLLGLVVGIWLGAKFSFPLGMRFGWTHNPPVDAAIFFIIIFVLVYVVAQFIGDWLTGRRYPSVIEKLLGAGVSAMEGALFLGAVGFAMRKAHFMTELIASSHIFGTITKAVSAIIEGLI